MSMEYQGQYLFGKPRTAFQNPELGQDQFLFGKPRSTFHSTKPTHEPLFRPFTNKTVCTSLQHDMTAVQQQPSAPPVVTPSVQQCRRPRDKEFEDLSKPCLCQRPLMTVYCRCCGYTGIGRTRRRCERHPQNIYLMDLDKCPQCMTYAGNLGERDAPDESFAASSQEMVCQDTLGGGASSTVDNTMEEDEQYEHLLISVTDGRGRSVCYQPPLPMVNKRTLRRPRVAAWPKQ